MTLGKWTMMEIKEVSADSEVEGPIQIKYLRCFLVEWEEEAWGDLVEWVGWEVEVVKNSHTGSGEAFQRCINKYLYFHYFGNLYQESDQSL
jgi:hypothetical protein